MTTTATSLRSRRNILRLALLGGVVGVAGCTLSHTGTTTIATLDVSRLLLDGRGIVAALKAALVLPGVAILLGDKMAVAEATLAAAGLAMDEIAQLVGGTVTVSIDTARVQALVLSLLGDAQTVLALLQMTPAANTAALPTQLSGLIAAAATLVPLVQQAAGLAGAPPRLAPMSEAEALRRAGVA